MIKTHENTPVFSDLFFLNNLIQFLERYQTIDSQYFTYLVGRRVAVAILKLVVVIVVIGVPRTASLQSFDAKLVWVLKSCAAASVHELQAVGKHFCMDSFR